MSTFKPFLTSDVIVSPFKVNKQFKFTEIELSNSDVEINKYYGYNYPIPSLWVSGSYPTGQTNIQDEILVYNSIKELYYTNYLKGVNGSPVSTASFNNDGTITGPTYTPNYYNYLPNTLLANRYFPTQSFSKIGVISIPSNLYGEYIKPGSVVLVSTTPQIVLIDDGEGGLTSGSFNPLNGTFQPTTVKYGDIIYEHGIITLTSASAFFLSQFINDDINLNFESTVTIYETQYKCTIRENEFNFSNNQTQISGSTNSGILYDFATGSFFTPYATTVGLYDNSYNLLAVAKLSQPLPLSSVTDTSILINLDL
jgi:hypothetical protein